MRFTCPKLSRLSIELTRLPNPCPKLLSANPARFSVLMHLLCMPLSLEKLGVGSVSASLSSPKES